MEFDHCRMILTELPVQQRNLDVNDNIQTMIVHVKSRAGKSE